MEADTILSKLQSSDLCHIHRNISAHLRPFKSLTNPNPNPNETRPLAKRYISFLNRSLSLIPNRLFETPQISPFYAPDLFASHNLCLQCLDCISSQLSCKPYSVHLQQSRLIRCYKRWGMYVEAEREGFSMLGSLGGFCKDLNFGGEKRRFVPDLSNESVIRDLVVLVAEIVVTIVKCVYMKGNKE